MTTSKMHIKIAIIIRVNDITSKNVTVSVEEN